MSETAAGAPGTLFLERRHFETLLKLLRAHVPGREVWAFGSRATGKYVWRFSDIDLAVAGTLSQNERHSLKEALEASTLPVKVDVVELGRVDAAFADRIGPDLAVLPTGAPEEITARTAAT